MKSGVRTLGVAESFRDERSTLAGVVTRASRIVDGFSFGECTVGSLDATDAISDLYDRLGREDAQSVMVSGIALAWYNLVDLHRLHEATARPVISVTYEASDGLETGLRDAFDGTELDARLAIYEALPPRHELQVGAETVWVRCVGCEPDEAAELVRGFTPEGGRPEPLRVARLAARAADEWWH
ncbi:DUF99 family protein [Haladaptatus sp. DYSN1]|uniref:endonuclease dU n=1 Tax=unclassified Haladaptatus TaxID=2622732 RepID=UPI00240592AF|nr:DUF99 family protein [Haladaptatus sp. DYSN1]